MQWWTMLSLLPMASLLPILSILLAVRGVARPALTQTLTLPLILPLTPAVHGVARPSHEEEAS